MDAAHAPDPDLAEVDRLLGDARLTAMGLLIETFTGIVDAMEHDLEQKGLAGSSFEIMMRLTRSPDHRLRMTELAAQSTLTNSGLTRVVDRLERDGLVRRRPCDHDRRGYWAEATAAGLAKVGAMLPDHLRTVDEAFTGVLDPDELAAFLDTLRRLRAVVRPLSDPQLSAAVPDA
jgi:DNA-binding MarR family transcriptional regulator